MNYTGKGKEKENENEERKGKKKTRKERKIREKERKEVFRGSQGCIMAFPQGSVRGSKYPLSLKETSLLD